METTDDSFVRQKLTERRISLEVSHIKSQTTYVVWLFVVLDKIANWVLILNTENATLRDK